MCQTSSGGAITDSKLFEKTTLEMCEQLCNKYEHRQRVELNTPTDQSMTKDDGLERPLVDT